MSNKGQLGLFNRGNWSCNGRRASRPDCNVQSLEGGMYTDQQCIPMYVVTSTGIFHTFTRGTRRNALGLLGSHSTTNIMVIVLSFLKHQLTGTRAP